MCIRDSDKDVTIAVDSTGIKVSNRGEWIRKKWKVKRGFIKVHIAVDIKTKQILAIEVTREDVGDGRMLGRLVEGSARKANVKRVIGDGAYDLSLIHISEPTRLGMISYA